MLFGCCHALVLVYFSPPSSIALCAWPCRPSLPTVPYTSSLHRKRLGDHFFHTGYPMPKLQTQKKKKKDGRTVECGCPSKQHVNSKITVRGLRYLKNNRLFIVEGLRLRWPCMTAAFPVFSTSNRVDHGYQDTTRHSNSGSGYRRFLHESTDSSLLPLNLCIFVFLVQQQLFDFLLELGV